MFDSHAHLDLPQFDADREEVLRRAAEAGVTDILVPGIDPASSERALALAEQHTGVYAAVGIHPNKAAEATEEDWRRLEELARSGAVALGETGLDYYRRPETRRAQREALLRTLALAGSLDLPVILHCRDAEDDLIAVLRDSPPRRGVIHCFSGHEGLAEAALSLGLYISVGGPLTYPSAESLRRAVASIPTEKMLIETDCPYLAPQSHRGERNEPAWLPEIAGVLAALHNCSLEDVARTTTVNARKLFLGDGGKTGEALGGAIAYRIRNTLYLNITNRCTNACSFCVRTWSDFVKGHRLWLEREPTVDEIIEAIGDPSGYDEVVFCGYGEPTTRLDALVAVGRWLRGRARRVRLDTNGHANLIHGRDVTPELGEVLDAVSVSLNAPDEETYQRLCNPSFGPKTFHGVVDFIRLAKAHVPEVTATVVAVPGLDTEACRRLCEELGVPLRVRQYHVVG